MVQTRKIVTGTEGAIIHLYLVVDFLHNDLMLYMSYFPGDINTHILSTSRSIQSGLGPHQSNCNSVHLVDTRS
jgi:hypothetical protein